MTQRAMHRWLLGGLALILGVIVSLTIAPYGWNVSSLLHMDHRLGDQVNLPQSVVVLGVPSYDGAQYYQVARNIPTILKHARWHELTERSPGSYAYQRLLLPVVAFILAAGQDALLPIAFLIANIGALLIACLLFLRFKPGKGFYALALCLCPAAMVALHFSLAEPLTIGLLLPVILRYASRGRLALLDVALLSLAVLTREVNILFIGYLAGYVLLQRRWRDGGLLLVPLLTFLAWHAIIFLVFGNFPFFMSAAAHELPGKAALHLVIGTRGYNRYTLSAIALFLGFVLPATLWTGRLLLVRRMPDVTTLGAFAFLCLMLIMPDYIWGSITSIGRVITPVYPLLMVTCADRKGWMPRYLASAVLVLGVTTALGLAWTVHPFTVT